MSDIFREVDEEVRRDQATEMWRKYQTPILVVAALVILAVGGWRGYDYWRTKQSEQAGAKYEAALELARAGKTGDAETALQTLAGETNGGYRILARLKAASQTALRDPEEAIKTYDAIAADGAVEPLFQDVARLRAALLTVDSGEAADAAKRLEPLAVAGNPFRHSAREMLAVVALKHFEAERAAKYLDQIIVDSGAPPAIKARAEIMMGLVRGAKPAGT